MPFFTIFAFKLARASLVLPFVGGFITVIAGITAVAGAIQAPTTLRVAQKVILCNIANLLLMSPYLFSMGAKSGIGPFPLIVTMLLAVQLSLLAGLIAIAKTTLFINKIKLEVFLNFNEATRPIAPAAVANTLQNNASPSIEPHAIRAPQRPKGRKPISHQQCMPVHKAA